MLAQLPLDTLHITRPADERAWQTLLEAMPASCPIQHVVLFGQRFDEASTLGLFQALGGMPDLHSVRFEWCNVTFRALLNPPSCPPLLEMRNLYVSNTDNPEILVLGILNASPNLGKLHLDFSPGIADKKYAKTLADSHASTLHTLTLRALRDEQHVAHYTALMKKSTALTHLDLSMNDLSSSTCQLLKEAALSSQTGLTSLSLAGCWPQMPDDKFDWEQVAGLVSLKSLVSLDLSGNEFPSSMKPVLLAISDHPSLQSLNLCDVTMSAELITEGLSVILEKNKTLISLQLPNLKDSDLGPLIKAMKSNYSLQSLSIGAMEPWLSKLSAEARQLYPNYLALMEIIALNQRAREVALVEGGMRAVLGGMVRINPALVPLDIARYAAQHVVVEGRDNSNEVMALTLLGEHAHKEGLDALKRLQEKK